MSGQVQMGHYECHNWVDLRMMNQPKYDRTWPNTTSVSNVPFPQEEYRDLMLDSTPVTRD